MPTKSQKPKVTPAAAGCRADASCSAWERVIAALLTPTVETMRLAGISRLTIEGGSVLLQMQDGKIIGPLRVGDQRRVLGTLISWCGREIGGLSAIALLDMMEPNASDQRPATKTP